MLTILIGFGSCGVFTPEKRLKRLVKNHPHLLTQKTIIVRDTIRDTIEHIVKGQALSISTSLGDLSKPIILNRGFLHLSASMNEQKDSIFINAKCDTVYLRIPYEKIIEIPVEVKTVEVKEYPLMRVLKGFLLFIVGFSVFMALFRATQNKKQPKEPPE